MKRTSRTIRTRISAATTPEFFADMPFNLVSETMTIARTKQVRLAHR